ncbi:MAG: ferredoxin-thioredoxin reductase catalytic domain-containing protein, partial [Potamolinea sp.]
HCMLFLTPENEFSGEKQDISMEEIQAVRDSMA